MLIQIIHIFYYQGDFMFLILIYIKSLKYLIFFAYKYILF